MCELKVAQPAGGVTVIQLEDKPAPFHFQHNLPDDWVHKSEALHQTIILEMFQDSVSQLVGRGAVWLARSFVHIVFAIQLLQVHSSRRI